MVTLPVITTETQLDERLERRRWDEAGSLDTATAILKQVQEKGDTALRELTEMYDHVRIDDLSVPSQELETGEATLSDELRDAVLAAVTNIRRFHERQLPRYYAFAQDDGTRVEWRWRPVDRVGVYVPGGRYPLLSTLLMNVIPAQVAGVEDIAVCTPPGPSGYPDKALLGICVMLGIREVYRLGGAQAIAAMAYGTQSVRAVDRITGPGSSYVAAAKLAAAGRVGIDMLAGPTEIVILADESAHPDWVAADLIAQAEHDPQAWPILVTHAPGLAAAVNTSLNHLLNGLRTRETASAALREQGFIYQASNPAECLEVVNRIAPEHLALHVTAVDAILKRVRAGAVFIGGQTPVAWGDYWAGPNHTLPTMGHARFRGPLSVLDFLVPYAVIMAGRHALRESGPVVRILAEQEGLAGHALSVALRDGSYG